MREEDETDFTTGTGVELPISLAVEAAQALTSEETTGESHTPNNRTRTRKHLQNISCWMILLTFAVIVLQSLISFFNELLLNERFWENTKHFLEMYKQHTETRSNNNL